MPSHDKIQICLWFDNQAEQAANFYCSIFPNSRIVDIARYGKAGFEHHRQPVGAVMLVNFELNGQPFGALNGGPMFKFNEAVSFPVMCDDQREVDYYWDKLTAGGDPKAQQCGWLKDKFGLSWQVVPRMVFDLIKDPTNEFGQRAMSAIMQMKKPDIATIERAARGG